MAPSLKKVLVILLAAVFIFAAALAGGLLYLGRHPDAAADLVQKAARGILGDRLVAGEISFSFRPLNIKAEKILVRSKGKILDYSASIEDLAFSLGLEGGFGNKTLIVRDVRVWNPLIEVVDGRGGSGDSPLPEGPSLLHRLAGNICAILFFREIRFQGGVIHNGGIRVRSAGYEADLTGVEAALRPDRSAQITGSGRVVRAAGDLSVTMPGIRLELEPLLSVKAPRIKGNLQVRGIGLDFRNISLAGASLDSGFDYQHGSRGISFHHLSLTAPAMKTIVKGGREVVLPGFRLQAKGSFGRQDALLEFASLKLDMEPLISLDSRGRVHAATAPQTAPSRLELDILHCLLGPEEIRQTIDYGTLPPFHLSGRVELSGILNVEIGRQVRPGGDLGIRLRTNPFKLAMETPEMAGVLDGEIRVEGQYPDLRVEADIRSKDTSVHGTGARLEPFEAAIRLSGPYLAPEIEKLQVHIPAVGTADGRDPALRDVRITAREGRLGAEDRSLSFKKIRLESSSFKNLESELSWLQGKGRLRVYGSETGLVQALLSLALPPGWKGSGKDSLEIEAASGKAGDWTIDGKIRVQGLSFQDPDGIFMGDGVDLRLDTRARVSKSGRTVFNVSLDFKEGELLLDRFYMNLKLNPLEAALEGDYGPAEKILGLSGLDLEIRELFTLKVAGEFPLDQRPLNLSVHLPEAPLGPLYRNLLLEPLKAEMPVLTGLNPQGVVSADIRLTASPLEWSALGQCRLKDGDLTTPGGATLQGVRLDLPLWYVRRHRPVPARDGLSQDDRPRLSEGRLSIRRIVLPVLPEQSIDVSLKAAENLLLIPSETPVKIPEGELILGPVTVRDYLEPGALVRTSMRLNGMGLGPLLSARGFGPVEGTVNGVLEPVTYHKHDLITRGELKADLFGGEVVISNLGASGLLTRAPVYGLSAEWRDIDLGEMTSVTPFGKIQGVLQGYLRGLELARGQPQKFELQLETSKQPGIPQRISIKAIESIAQIGGGQSPFVGLAGAFASFFETLPYEKIGLRALLQNDLFRINGTIRENGTEYLIKRGGFSGVNVVNQNPDNLIPFKDMVNRIRRITSGQGGAVIR